jgi:hypothetical protein
MIIILFLLACAETKCAEVCGDRGYVYVSEMRGVGYNTPASCTCGPASSSSVDKTP